MTTTPDDAPTATNLSTAETYTEDTPLNLVDIVVSDVDSANVTATLTLSNVAAGSLSTATSGAVTSTYNAATGVWTASGAIANVNALLAGLTLTPAANFNGSFSIATSISDGVAPAITGSKAFTGIAVNDAPTATNLSAAETYTEDTPLNLVDIVVSDVDSANVTATLTLSNAAAGSLSTATSGAVTSTYNAATGVWTASGAIANVNALLAGLTLTPAANFNGSFSIATSVSDGVAPAITGSKAFTGISLFTASNTPAQTNLNDGPQLEVGVKFQSSVAGQITALKFYRSASDTGADILDLWTSTATNLASVTFTNTAASGWQTVSLATPVAISANTTYVASYHTTGSYVATDNFFTTAFTSGALTAPSTTTAGGNGVYAYGGTVTAGIFPTNTFGAANYWADVVFASSAAERRADGDQPVGGRDLHGRHPAQPGRHRGERCRQCECDGDPDAVQCGGGQPEHGDLGRGHLDLQCRHRGVDGLRRDRRRQCAAGGGDADAGGELQRQLLDRHQRQRRGGAGHYRQQGVHRDRGQRCADGDQPVGGRDLHGRHPAQPGRHRGERCRQCQCDGDPDAVQCGGGQPEHGDLGRGHLDLQCRHRGVDGLRRDRRRQCAAGGGDADAGGELQRQFLDRHQRQRRGGAGHYRQQGVHHGTAVNAAPTATNLSAAETYTEDTPLNLVDIVVSDVDSANVTATLTLSNVAAGSLSTATSGAVTSTYNAGTGVWTASGAIADVNALLAGVAFTPAANFNGSFSIATSVSDGVAPAITGSKAFTGTAVNDAPTATNLSAAETYTEDTPLNLVDIVVSDVDSAECDGDPDAVQCGGGQPEHGDLGRGHLDLHCRHRGLDGLRRDRRRQCAAGGGDADAGGELQWQFLDRHQRQRRGGAGHYRQQGVHHGTAVNAAPTISNLAVSATSISFVASDPDNATLSLASPFASAFGNPAITSGATTSLTPSAQTTAVSGTLQVTDGSCHGRCGRSLSRYGRKQHGHCAQPNSAQCDVWLWR